MTIDIRTLFTAATADSILAAGLELCASLGLPVTAWQVDNPSRVILKWLASSLASRDDAASVYIQSGFLSSATGSWKTLVAQEVYGVTRTAATYATVDVTLSNGGGGVYVRDAGEVILKASGSGVTYRSTEAMSLASGPGTSVTIACIADEAGSAGTVGVDGVDEIVSTMLGVTISGSTAGVGVDEQSDDSLEEECFATIGRASPNGPPDAYNATVLDADLTGAPLITRAHTTEDASDGTVTVYVATSSGAVSSGDVALAQAAVEIWSTPAGMTPTVVSATVDPQSVALNISGEDIPATAETDIEALIVTYYSTVSIGGYVSSSALVSLAHEYLVDAGATEVEVTNASGTGGQLAEGYVATVSSVTVTEV